MSQIMMLLHKLVFLTIFYFICLASTVVNFCQYCEDEMSSPFPNRKKLIGVRLFKEQDPISIPIENDMDGEDTSIEISFDHVTIVEYDVIEPLLLGKTDFELSFNVSSTNK